MLNDRRSVACPICGSAAVGPRGAIAYAAPVRFSTMEIEIERTPELWRCQDCRSGFVQNTLPEAAAAELYRQGDSTARWSARSLEETKTPQVLAELARVCVQGKRLLDIGANAGNLLDFAMARGCATDGVEYSAAARSVLERKGHRAYASLDQVAAGYDLITAFDVVEHQYDLPGFIASCRTRLRPGGRLIVLTGDIDCIGARISGSGWWYAGYPEHIAFPSLKALERQPGFALERCVRTYASRPYCVPWIPRLRGIALSLARGEYRGLPAPGPDHLLATLRAAT